MGIEPDYTGRTSEHQLRELGRLVAHSEVQIFDLPKIDALGEALDFALTLIPGWNDRFIDEH